MSLVVSRGCSLFVVVALVLIGLADSLVECATFSVSAYLDGRCVSLLSWNSS